MKHFKDENNKVWAFESDEDMEKFRPGLTPITDAERGELLAPTQEELDEKRKQEIYARLAQIDQESIRPLRAGETDKVAALEAEAETLRIELKELEND